jgi:hypothetical protein
MVKADALAPGYRCAAFEGCSRDWSTRPNLRIEPQACNCLVNLEEKSDHVCLVAYELESWPGFRLEYALDHKTYL